MDGLKKPCKHTRKTLPQQSLAEVFPCKLPPSYPQQLAYTQQTKLMTLRAISTGPKPRHPNDRSENADSRPEKRTVKLLHVNEPNLELDNPVQLEIIPRRQKSIYM